MWQTYTLASVLALSFSAVAFGVAKGVVMVGARRIERRYGATGVRDTLARRAKLEQGLEARKAERNAALRRLDSQSQEFVRRRQTLDRRLQDATRGGDPIFRLIGEEVAGSPCFVGEVLNKYVGTGNAPSALIDPVWAQAQKIEVWAPTIQEARKELERRYPPSFGYKVTRLQEIGSPLKAGT